MKHKKFTMIVALVLVVALAAGLGIWATGEEKLPTVTYYDGNDGNNARFAFTNTGKGSATDLFANFSNCMPGDSLTQTICVKADSANVMVMILELESEFGIEVEDEVILTLKTVGDVVDYIEKHQ